MAAAGTSGGATRSGLSFRLLARAYRSWIKATPFGVKGLNWEAVKERTNLAAFTLLWGRAIRWHSPENYQDEWQRLRNVLYYGDNLDVLRRYIKDESVDLIYLDPPFKSNQDYNVLFADQRGRGLLLRSRHSKILGDGTKGQLWH